MKFFDIFKATSLNHLTRILYTIEPALEIIEKNAPKHIKEKTDNYLKKLRVIHKKTLTFFYISVFLYLMLYISLVSILTKNLFFFEEAVKFLNWIAGMVGSFFIIAVLFVMNKIVQVNISEALVLAGYITAYSAKYDRPKKGK